MKNRTNPAVLGLGPADLCVFSYKNSSFPWNAIVLCEKSYKNLQPSRQSVVAPHGLPVLCDLQPSSEPPQLA